MDKLRELKEKLNKERAKFEVEEDMEKREKEIKEIKKELKEIHKKSIIRKYNPIISTIKKTASIGGKMLDNLEMDNERKEHGHVIGSRIIITNGIYKNDEMKVSRLIPGGIEGMIGINIVKIRHGSYRKL